MVVPSEVRSGAYLPILMSSVDDAEISREVAFVPIVAICSDTGQGQVALAYKCFQMRSMPYRIQSVFSGAPSTGKHLL